MEIINAALIAINMLIGGGQAAPINGSAATISNPTSSIIVVTDTMEQN